MASQIIGEWELLIILVPNGTFSNGDAPSVIPMQVTRQMIVAVEQDYFNRRIDECLEITLTGEANEEDWINNFDGDELPRMIGERTSLHALADAIEMGQTNYRGTGSRRSVQDCFLMDVFLTINMS